MGLKMRLRSQKTLVPCPETPQRTPRRTQKRRRPEEEDSPLLVEQVEEAVDLPADDEVPTMRRRMLPRGRQTKRAIAVEESDLAFNTPIRPISSIMRHKRVLSEIDPVSPRNTTARTIYTPIVRFLTPSKENLRSPGIRDTVLLSPEQGFFGYSSMELLGGEEEEEIFNPFTFIKNIPPQSEHSRPSSLRDVPPKTRSTPEATLVVDLDETLMFSSLNKMEAAEYSFYTAFQDHRYEAYMVLRPHVKDFLQAMAKVYEIFVYTCAKKEYAEKILDIMDPQKKVFRHRLYQEDCACVQGHYVKDLNILGRDLRKTVVLDNAPHTYPYHLMNTIPIKSWTGESEDRELLKLIPYMEKLASAEDFQEVLKKRKDHFHRLLSED